MSGPTTCFEEQIQQLRSFFDHRYPGLVRIHLVDMMTSDDEETHQAYYLIKSRAIVPPLVTVNRRLCLYGELDTDSLQQAVHQELERHRVVPQSS